MRYRSAEHNPPSPAVVHRRRVSILFLVKTVTVALVVGFVILVANLLVRISLVVGGHYQSSVVVLPQPLPHVPFFGHGVSGRIDPTVYGITAALVFIFIAANAALLGGLLLPRRPRRLRIGVASFSVAQTSGLVVGAVWTALFSFNDQHRFLFTNALGLTLINTLLLLLAAFYGVLNQRLGRLQLGFKPTSPPAVIIPAPPLEPFFAAQRMSTLSHKQRFFYVRSCKNRAIFSLDRHWMVILKIYSPQILLSLMWVGYEVISRLLLNRFAPAHYLPHLPQYSPAEVTASLNLALRYSNSVYAGLFVVVNFVTAPLQLLFARAYARQDQRTAERVISFAVFMSLILTVLVVALGMGLTNVLIRMQQSTFNPDSDRVQVLATHIARRIILCTIAGLPIIFAYYIIFDLLICEGRFLLFLITSVVTIGFQIFFIWLLVRFSNLKALAAPLGDFISSLLVFMMVTTVIACDQTSWIRFRWRWVRPYPRQMFTFCKIGLSIVIKIMTVIIAQVLFVRLTQDFPVTPQDINTPGHFNQIVQLTATYGIYVFFVRSFFIGMSIANRQVLTYCYSRRLWYRLRKIAAKALLLDLCWWLLCNVLVWTVGIQALHWLNATIPAVQPKLRLFFALIVAGVINRAVTAVLTDVLQAAGKKDEVVVIFVINLLFGVLATIYVLWAGTWAVFPVMRWQFFLFLYSLVKLVVSIVIAVGCWYKFKPLYHAIMRAKLTDDKQYVTDVQYFRSLLVTKYDNNIRLMVDSDQWVR